jgi:hypothetical protein
MEVICNSDIIIHDDGYICCNICQHEEINNNTGVCECCADNRVEDGIWSIKQRYSNNLRTNINGEIKNN